MNASGRTLGTVALLVLVVTAGCLGGGDSDQGADPWSAGNGGGDGDVAAGPEATAAPSAGNGDAADVEGVEIQDRARIKTGHVELRVDDFGAARENLSSAAESYGGFVGDTTERRHGTANETYRTGVVVLRVPQEDFSSLMADVRAEGEVLEAREETEDVTERLVDLEARLENLRTQRDRLRELYEEAEDTSDVLEVEERLSEVQSEIERLEARKQSLERKVALSTIRVELREPEPDRGPPEVDQWYETGVLSAFLDSVHGVLVTGRALIVATAYVLPYVIAFGGPIAVAGFGVRRYRAGKPDGPAPPDDEDG